MAEEPTASLRGLIARLHRCSWLDVLGWEGIYELLEALREIGPDAKVAGPALLRLHAALQHEVAQGRERWAPVVDATAQAIKAFGDLRLRVNVDRYFPNDALWPGTTVAFRPRDLDAPTAPPHSDEREGPRVTESCTNAYFDDLEGPSAPGVIGTAAAMGIPLDERRYGVFMRYAENPAREGYLAQLQILTEPWLRKAVGDEGLWAFPEQPATIGMALEGFVDHQRDECSRDRLASWLYLDGPEPNAEPELGFGLRVEDTNGQAFRIWSRGWLDWR